MWDFSVGRSIRLMVQTLPFILLRLAVYFGVTFAFILGTGTGAGAGWSVGALGDADFRTAATLWGAFMGFLTVAGIAYWLREYVLYIVKAGHIAVMVELLDDRPLPHGRSQIEHAASVVKERFAEASVLFAVDQLIKGVLRAITGLMRGAAIFAPLPGVQQVISLVRAFLNVAVGFVDEVILAYAIRTRSTNPWATAKEALILYGQNYKTMLRNAAWLAAIVYLLSLVVFLAALAPATLAVYLAPGAWSAGGFLVALLLAWSVKTALFDPFAVACLMQAYFKAVEGQTPDAAWEERLSKLSRKFRKLGERAVRGAPPEPAVAHRPA